MGAEKKDILKDYLKEVGQNVRKHRIDRGMSMEDLGIEVGLDRMNINRIEKGLNMTLSTILKLSLALDLKPYELLKTDVSAKSSDLDTLVTNNRGSKLKKGKKSEVIRLSDIDFDNLRKKNKSKELQQAVKDLHDAIKRIHTYKKNKAS